MTTIAEALRRARRALEPLPQSSPYLEASLLLSLALERPRSYLLAWPERPLSRNQASRFQVLLQRRLAGEPMAHITGEQEFWSLPLRVTPATLVPRPETELLVELALERLPLKAGTHVLDLGTGSGAIAAALAVERPLCRILATDVDAAALAVARENFRRLGLEERVDTAQGSWFGALPGEEAFGLIVSNPPYIPEGDPHLRQGDLPREPEQALVAGADGLEAIRIIAREAPQYLRPGGWLLLEHGWDQGAAVRELLAAAGFLGIASHRDPGGHERVTRGRRGG